MKPLFRTLATLLGILLIISAQAAMAADAAGEFKSARKDLDYIRTQSNATRQSYVIVAEKFISIYNMDPAEKVADDALYFAGKTFAESYSRFKSRSDLLSALKYFRLLAVNYDSYLAAAAYLEASDLYVEQRDYPSAKFMLNRLIGKFPKDKRAGEAKEKLAEIEKQFSKGLYADADAVEDDPKDDGNSDIAITTADTGSTSTPPPGKTFIKSIRHFSGDQYTRVVIDTNGPADYEKHWLREDPKNRKPPRLFIDVFNSAIDGSVPTSMNIRDGLLSAVRWGKRQNSVTRIVLDSQSVKDFTVFRMENPHRIVIDVSGRSLSTVARDDSDVGGGNQTLAQVFGLKIRRIVIDPGHGGKDPGCTYHGAYEKDIVLDIALELKKLFEADKDLEVFLTRERDIFIPLEERTAFANRKKADIFISIHVNASKNKNTRGVETYVLNVTNDKSALEVAALENKATEKSLSDLQGILKDIMLNSKLEESLMLASLAQDGMVKRAYGNADRSNLGVKQAPFYVLVGAMMPSILVETGFLSNREEAKLFKSRTHRKRIAEGIHSGIIDYIHKHNNR